MQPAPGAALQEPPAPLSDLYFAKVVAVLRLSLPYAGIILSTRECPELRNRLLSLGISQMSAGSSVTVGGYGGDGEAASGQFLLGDHRTLGEVVRDICREGYIPSFCTTCYRVGRTGERFMELSKPGLIQKFCLPNALLTFAEYLRDYADEEAQRAGERVLKEQMKEIKDNGIKGRFEEHLARIRAGEDGRDLYI